MPFNTDQIIPSGIRPTLALYFPNCMEVLHHLPKLLFSQMRLHVIYDSGLDNHLRVILWH